MKGQLGIGRFRLCPEIRVKSRGWEGVVFRAMRVG
jgi:hypothetical protein